MNKLAVLLRAVNVGGTGMLAMRDLVALCESLGFVDVRTYIQSGNVVFRTALAPAAAGTRLASALETRHALGSGLVVRTAREMRTVCRGNPFQELPPAKVSVLFASHTLRPRAFDGLQGPAGERVVVRARELYISYPEGMGRSKLKLPVIEGVTTVRNMNTVAKVAELCDGLGD